MTFSWVGVDAAEKTSQVPREHDDENAGEFQCHAPLRRRGSLRPSSPVGNPPTRPDDERGTARRQNVPEQDALEAQSGNESGLHAADTLPAAQFAIKWFHDSLFIARRSSLSSWDGWSRSRCRFRAS